MPTVHELKREWRRPRVNALQTDALAIRETIEHLDDLVALFEYEAGPNDQNGKAAETVVSLRTMVGTLKSLASDRENEAERLQAEIETREKEE